jgi:peptide/nickel transport system permease protein
MLAYVARRLLLIPVTLILITMIVFVIERSIPGNVVDLIESEMAASATGGQIDRAAVEHALGLDVPIHIQYVKWIGNIVIHGDFGKTLRGGKSVIDDILQRLPVTLELSLLAILIGVTISIPLGIFSAIRQDSFSDYLGRTIAILAISIPIFWTATLIMIYPSIWWGWSPPMDVVSFAKNPLRNLSVFIIPALVMGASMTGATMRMMRTMMLEVLRQDYLRTAYAKGLSESTIIIKHAVKNALIPVITVIGNQLPMLIGGSIIIEQIFSLPGMGRLLFTAISEREYPTISAITVLISVFVLCCNFLVDLIYGWLDPRVKYE